ncbi:hypothetical protein EXIGLDRAFT_41658 [Exidia glandulosa HHB12029]|uniref:Uncharacterized protein n=1 Tax=Exidia glandulosa HHB12029 TaxID=1314781 RepID=A0A165IKF2_EXIGL|nr:hypothetical protein EXIGLDRAFT_41658 [Exidia glandulosa HHB12029]
MPDPKIYPVVMNPPIAAGNVAQAVVQAGTVFEYKAPDTRVQLERDPKIAYLLAPATEEHVIIASLRAVQIVHAIVSKNDAGNSSAVRNKVNSSRFRYDESSTRSSWSINTPPSRRNTRSCSRAPTAPLARSSPAEASTKTSSLPTPRRLTRVPPKPRTTRTRNMAPLSTPPARRKSSAMELRSSTRSLRSTIASISRARPRPSSTTCVRASMGLAERSSSAPCPTLCTSRASPALANSRGTKSSTKGGWTRNRALRSSRSAHSPRIGPRLLARRTCSSSTM